LLANAQFVTLFYGCGLYQCTLKFKILLCNSRSRSNTWWAQHTKQSAGISTIRGSCEGN